MAIMFPKQLPDRVLGDRKLKGEIGTYEALSKLPDEFEIFYNRSISVRQGSKAYKRRIDFIVLHEKLGLLAIEVKGGKIRIGQDGGVEQYHPFTKEWASIDPYTQVERATIELIKDCKANGANYWIPADTCVIFSNTFRRDITDTPHILPSGTLCADDLPVLVTQIPNLFSKYKKESAWSREALLDMRRRLQNMPEAKRGNMGLSNRFKAKKPFSELLPNNKTIAEKTKNFLKHQNKEFDEKDYCMSEYIEENIAKMSSTPYEVSHYSRNDIGRSSEVVQNIKLELWQIIMAIVIGSLVSLTYAWFLPNSLLRKLF